MASVLMRSIRWHRGLSWLGGITLLLFAVSGISHTVMTWTGPRAVTFFPPKTTVQAHHVRRIPAILQHHSIDRAMVVKIVPSDTGALLQVTTSDQSPRRYFNLVSGEEMPSHDAVQAVWLARYYTGLTHASVESIAFQTQFDGTYPWVNRLLPVYRVTFDTPDKLTAFIYTELGALASLTNTNKNRLKTLFQALHTWHWLDGFAHARVVLMLILLGSLIGMAITGVAMVMRMANRTMPRVRTWHRWISIIIWFPILAFSASGTYHLLQHAYSTHPLGVRLVHPMVLTRDRWGHDVTWLNQYEAVQVNGISLVEHNNRLLYRLSAPHPRSDQAVSRQRRYDGTPIEASAQYVDALQGRLTTLTDADVAQSLVQRYMGISSADGIETTRVTRFGATYDFRNKRLPVWQVTLNNSDNTMVFVDPATGILVDQNTARDRYERYAFSMLHKWHFLQSWLGRMGRDIVIMGVLLMAMVATGLGYALLFKNKK